MSEASGSATQLLLAAISWVGIGQIDRGAAAFQRVEALVPALATARLSGRWLSSNPDYLGRAHRFFRIAASLAPPEAANALRQCLDLMIGPKARTDIRADLDRSRRAAAEAMLADPAAAKPWLTEAVAAWHCLATPLSHRGKVNWRGHVEDGTPVRPAEKDPGGPLVVVTSAGFLSRVDDVRPRIRLFVKGVAEALAWYGGLPANLRADALNGPDDGRNGLTCALRRSDDVVREAACQDGCHHARMEENRAGLMFDYSSFTRLRAMKSHGDWDGDPFADLDQGGRAWCRAIGGIAAQQFSTPAQAHRRFRSRAGPSRSCNRRSS